MKVTVEGPKILYKIPLPWGDSIPFTETMRNGIIVVLVISLICFFLGRKLSVKNPSKRQLAAEKLVLMLEGMVEGTMGKHNMFFVPYMGALFAYSALSSLCGLFALRPPTGDINTTIAFALVAFFLIQFFNIKNRGIGGWLKGFAEPVALLTPLNLVGEIANPISMAFRHFGNIASGIVISTLLYGALAALSESLLGANAVPVFQIGIPAVLSLYFDIFTSFLQAYIVVMLTMVYVGGANEAKSE